MRNFKLIIIMLLLIVIIFGIVMIHNNKEKNNMNNIDNTNISEIKAINEELLEKTVKELIIEEVAKKLFKNDEGTYAEGHKILKSEIKDNKIYAYVVSEFGVYKITNNEAEVLSARACPLTFIFNEKYEFEKVLIPDEENKNFDITIKNILFPEDLIPSAKVDYSVDFYRNQIKSYLTNQNNNSSEEKTENSNAIIYIGTTTNFKSFDVKVDKTQETKEQAKFLIKQIGEAIGYDIKINEIYSGKGGITVDLQADSAPFNITDTYIRK